jgi:hypothetical protein
MLTVIDEFSRFSFVFPCEDMRVLTVIKCLSQLFALFGMPSLIHFHRESSFMSTEKNHFYISKVFLKEMVNVNVTMG